MKLEHAHGEQAFSYLPIICFYNRGAAINDISTHISFGTHVWRTVVFQSTRGYVNRPSAGAPIDQGSQPMQGDQACFGQLSKSASIDQALTRAWGQQGRVHGRNIQAHVWDMNASINWATLAHIFGEQGCLNQRNVLSGHGRAPRPDKGASNDPAWVLQ